MKTGKVTDKSELAGFFLIAALFLASGFSSLIYQVVWTRALSLVFGSTTFAAATVLSVFMGGLALGSFAAATIADRIKRPFLWYGILEGVIGVWALLVPILFTQAVPVYRMVWQHFHPDLIQFSLFRCLIALAILVLPTSCMGATLPLLSRFVTARLDLVGQRAGTLYSVNTLGAVAGAALAGFVLLPAMGLSATTMVAALINLVLCAIVVVSAPSAERAHQRPPESQEESKAKPAGTSDRLDLATTFAIISFSISGALAMVYEVGWTRTLMMVIGSSTYAFSVMLTTFLTGIFAGSLLCARLIDRSARPLIWFAVMQLTLCLCGLSSLQFFNYLPWWNLLINAHFPHNALASLGVRFLLSSAILMPLTLCLGATFPAIVKACARELETVGKSVGTLYSVNTLGAIVGAFLAGFVLTPWLGVERMLVLASMVNLLLGLVLLLMLKQMSALFKVALVVLCLPVFWWCGLQKDIWDHAILLCAQAERRDLMRKTIAYQSFGEWQDNLKKNAKVLFWHDGASSTVGALQWINHGSRTLITNGHVDAGDQADRSTQSLITMFPLLWRPDSKDIAVIGWGSGMSVGTATLFPVTSITAVELEPSVVAASRFFHHINHHPEEDPRVHIEINDGRNYLLATDKRFDAIISEPSNPWQAGVCNLFTREYFQICHDRLKDNGVFSCWMQIAEVPPENLREIVASLSSVFPYNLVLSLDSVNLVVLSSDQPLSIDYRRLYRDFQNKAIAGELREFGINSPEALLAQVVAAPDGVESLVTGAPLNVDDNNRLEYTVGQTYENKVFFAQDRDLFKPFLGTPWKLVGLPGFPSQVIADIFTEVAWQALTLRPPDTALAWAGASLAVAPSPAAFRTAGAALAELHRRTDALSMWTQALALDPHDSDTLQLRGLDYLQHGSRLEARKDFQSVLAVHPQAEQIRYCLGQTYSDYQPIYFSQGGNPEFIPVHTTDHSAEQVSYWMSPLVETSFVSSHHSLLFFLAAAEEELGHHPRAESLLRRYLNRESQSISARVLLTKVLQNEGKDKELAPLWRPLPVGAAAASAQIVERARYRLKAGREDEALHLLVQAIIVSPANNDASTAISALVATNNEASQINDLLKAQQMKAQQTPGALPAGAPDIR
jgi:spermidine synthase